METNRVGLGLNIQKIYVPYFQLMVSNLAALPHPKHSQNTFNMCLSVLTVSNFSALPPGVNQQE